MRTFLDYFILIAAFAGWLLSTIRRKRQDKLAKGFVYMKKMAKTPTIDGRRNKPVSEAQIKSIEQKINKAFPKAYCEFLLLGGNGANMMADMDHEVISYKGEDLHWQVRQEQCKEELAEVGFIIARDFWIFGAWDSDEFHYFYFDDGDDPPVYGYYPYLIKDGKEYVGIEKVGDSFSAYINRRINHQESSALVTILMQFYKCWIVLVKAFRRLNARNSDLA